MGFIMDGLDAESYDRSYGDRYLVGRIVRYFRPHVRSMLVVAVAIVLTSLVDTSLPILISLGIDRLQQDRATDLLPFAVLITLVASSSWLFNFLRRWLSARVVGDVVLRVREDAFDAVLKRDLSFYDTIASGKIVSRVTSDTQSFSNVVTLTLDLMSQILLIFLLIGYLFLIDARLTLFTLALAPFIILAALSFRRIARETVTQSRRVRAVVSAHIQETVSGIGVAKTFRRERAVYDEFLDVNQQSYRVNLRTNFVFSAIFPILNIIAGAGTAVLVYFGGETARAGGLSPEAGICSFRGSRCSGSR
ncbi:MAG: ABC transporter ATP-binding protein [Anaerolineae bacterium]